MRLLVVTFGRPAPEHGAAQMALNLAQALAERGHEVVSWASGAAPPEVRWHRGWRWHREQLDGFLENTGPFDAIDLPPVAIGRRTGRAGPLVARSVQPDLLYFAVEARGELARLARSPLRAAAHLVHGARVNTAVVAGLRRAAVVLCLGGRERDWLARRLPWLRPKLEVYVNALAADDRAALALVRAARRRPAGPGVRWLWIGRWARHKGTARLARFIVERAAARPGDTFTIAGCGEAAIRDLPPRLLAEGRVRLVPGFARTDLPGILAAHDGGLFTSAVEGWGLTLNEMLESGMPVFATEAGGVPELRQALPGALRPFPPPLDPDLSSHLFDEEGYARRFTWERIARRYEETVLARLAR